MTISRFIGHRLSILALTAIVPVAAAFAQEPAPLEPPNGFIAVEAGLDWSDLRDVPVFDAAGEELGRIQGVVYEDGSIESTDEVASDIKGNPAPTATPEPDTAESQAIQAEREPRSPNDSTSIPRDDSSNVDAGTQGGDQEDVTETTDPTEAPQAGKVDETPASQGKALPKGISNVVIDVSTLLGTDARRVVVPFDELKPFRKETELRVFLPWTRA